MRALRLAARERTRKHDDKERYVGGLKKMMPGHCSASLATVVPFEGKCRPVLGAPRARPTLRSGCGAPHSKKRPITRGKRPRSRRKSSLAGWHAWKASRIPSSGGWTIPFFNGSEEDGDLCAWNFGDTYKTPSGATANLKLGSRDYLLRTNWINVGSGHCGLSY